MQPDNFPVDYDGVDFRSLRDDAEARTMAKQMLLNVLVQIGEAYGKTAWNESQRLYEEAGFKAKESLSLKDKFVQQAGEQYRDGASSLTKRHLEDRIFKELKQRMLQLAAVPS